MADAPRVVLEVGAQQSSEIGPDAFPNLNLEPDRRKRYTVAQLALSMWTASCLLSCGCLNNPKANGKNLYFLIRDHQARVARRLCIL